MRITRSCIIYVIKHADRPKQADRAKYYHLWYLKDDWKDIWQTSPVLGEKLIDLLITKN